MNLVKFQNGKYGVRRFSWLLLGYQFLDIVDQDIWWEQSKYVEKYSMGTKAQAESAMVACKMRRSSEKLKHEVVK